MTVLELAKELGIPVPKLKPTLGNLGVEVTRVSDILQEQDIQRVRQALGKPERPEFKRVVREPEPTTTEAPATAEAAAPERPQPAAPAEQPVSAPAPAPTGEQPQTSRPTAERPPYGGERPSGAGTGQRPSGQYGGPRPGGPGTGPRPSGRPSGPGLGQRPSGPYSGPRPGGQYGSRPGGPGGPRPGGPYTGPRPGGPGRPSGPRPPRFEGAPVLPAGTSRRDRPPQGQRAKPWERRDTPHRGPLKTIGGDAGTSTRWAPRRRGKREQQPAVRQREPEVNEITLTGPVSVKDLAAELHIDASRILGQLLGMGLLADINRTLDPEVAVKVGEKLGKTIHLELAEATEETPAVTRPTSAPRGKPVPRPPVVTIMGHVDHGKTTLLDAIRHTKVTEQEFGGITQHIGAYQVDVGEKKVTFLDTPGHEAFTAMRARGASVTDIAVLVVAADDGVMPQTIEAINHAQAAKVPIVVAINKIDRPEAQPDRIKQQLMEHGLVPEEWGGDQVMVPVSAKEKTGLDQLLEMLLLVAEMQDLKADPNVPAVGTVVEAELDKQRGPVATVLIQEGTLHVGDSVIAGTAHGKVRAMTDHTGKRIKAAGPSRPVQITGLDSVPQAGDVLEEVSGERLGKALSDSRQVIERADRMKSVARVSLQDLYQQIQTGEVKDLNIVLKADVQGSIEAIGKSLQQLGTAEVRTNIIHAGVGDVTESDVMLAAASSAIIIGFNVRGEAQAKALAEEQGIDVRLYQVIYDIIDDVRAAMVGLLAPVYEEEVVGRAEVKAVFKASKVGTIAGCGVTKGKIVRGADMRVLRGDQKVHQGKVDSLKHLKEDVREVLEGFECGIFSTGYSDVQIGDVIEVYRTREVRRETL